LNPFPKVSVYIVNHNYGRFLEHAVESVLSQSFGDFELLIFDNGSTDGSAEIISRYALHEKIAAFCQDNIGLSRTNNLAIRRARGQYVLRLDADDYLHHNALELLARTLDCRGDVGLVFPDYFLVDAEGKVLEVMQRHNFNQVTLLDQPAHGACTMIRRDCLVALNGYDESYHCQDGWDLWVRFIRRYGVANLNLPLFYYRKHGNSLSDNEQRILATRSQILERASAENGRKLQALAIIPIRGPSIDPRSVALKPLAGKKLLDWTIDAALAARRISRVVVTSPDADVAAHVGSVYGERLSFFNRDWELALPAKPLDATLTALFDELPAEWRTFDAVTLLYVESPFRGARYIDAAIDALDVFNANRVMGVRYLGRPLYCHQGEGMVPLNRSELLRQECHDVYRPAGDILVIRRGQFYRDTDQDMKIGHIELDERAAHKINSEWTWEIAETHATSLRQAEKAPATEADEPVPLHCFECMTASEPFTSIANAAFFIAEIGGNHEGHYDYALKLCDLAVESGADAIKLQLYRGDRLVSSVLSPDRNAHFKKFELSREQHIAIAEHVRRAGRHYMASVWDVEMLEWIDPFIEIHKVGSGDLTCYPMLKALAATGKPIILSTGLATLEEISGAIEFIYAQNAGYRAEGKLALLQCTTAYPTTDEAANLRVIPTFSEYFRLPVGYSDHTMGSDAIELAYALGARIFEKHFTDTREGKSFRDHQVSLTKDEVRKLLARLRRIEILLGSAEKVLTKAESAPAHEVSFRRGLHAGREIEAGEPLTEDNVVALRPRVGLCASQFYEVLGRRAARRIERLAAIRLEDLTP
jgi:N-acetylneuraminate synthase/N,N'-diacetyllegionaminate synthase